VSGITIAAVEIENLRGYTKAHLDLDRRTTVLVGNNNSGKTSVLRMLDWLLNEADVSLLRGTGAPSEEVLSFLLPARESHKRARRLSVYVRVVDGRKHKSYECVSDIARLRLQVREDPARLTLSIGKPRRKESAARKARALKLLDEVRQSHSFLYIPSFRDGESQRFKSTLLEAFRSRLAERGLHNRRGRAPAQSVTIKKALAAIQDVAQKLAHPLWDDMQKYLPAGMIRDAALELAAEPSDLVEWLAARLRLRISTGTHDKSAVPIPDLGSGLQSLLDLAVHRSGPMVERTTLVVEEPESFLHPSAQRATARALISDSAVGQTIVTTHSPIVVEEASYSSVVVCRDQQFYCPDRDTCTKRREINDALMSGFGAEMMFSRSVLLVEGESDRLFFETLRRRLAALDLSGRVDQLFVSPVGAKYSFAPWIRLLQSYASGPELPIAWLVAADGDAGSDVAKAFRDAEIRVLPSTADAITRAGAQSRKGRHVWAAALRDVNGAALKERLPLVLMTVDLEDAALRSATTKTL